MTAQIELIHFAEHTRGFLAELSENNSRAWFGKHKLRYDRDVRRPGELLVDRLAKRLAVQTGRPVRGKLFRPHRDVRFSDDKSPFFTHLHAAWTLPDGRGWYFGLSTDYATAGAGVMAFDPDQRASWRRAVSGPAGAALADLLARIDARLDPPTLEAVPEPHPPEHPRALLLRREGCVLWQDGLFDALVQDPEAALGDSFERVAPLQDWLGKHL